MESEIRVFGIGGWLIFLNETYIKKYFFYFHKR